MYDTPLAINLAQPNRQKKAVFVQGIARRVRPAPHDRDCKCDIRSGGDSELPKVERCASLVIGEL